MDDASKQNHPDRENWSSVWKYFGFYTVDGKVTNRVDNKVFG